MKLGPNVHEDKVLTEEKANQFCKIKVPSLRDRGQNLSNEMLVLFADDQKQLKTADILGFRNCF